jgi:hypothetical protein
MFPGFKLTHYSVTGAKDDAHRTPEQRVQEARKGQETP